jgi:hypothetical protein
MNGKLGTESTFMKFLDYGNKCIYENAQRQVPQLNDETQHRPTGVRNKGRTVES